MILTKGLYAKAKLPSKPHLRFVLIGFCSVGIAAEFPNNGGLLFSQIILYQGHSYPRARNCIP